MPLLDHFHVPLSMRRHWHAFHNSWATYISSHLNERLPEGYFAEANVQFGIEIDVATFGEGTAGNAPAGAELGWTPPAPTLTVPITLLTDTVEIRIISTQEGPVLTAAIELVSPANKDRPLHRDAFVSKCAAYLQQGISLGIVDPVTDRRANLHHELLERLQAPVSSGFDDPLYAVAYRPVEREGQSCLDIWQEALAVGQPLPTLPVWLPGSLYLPLDLEATYERTCREQRIQGGTVPPTAGSASG